MSANALQDFGIDADPTVAPPSGYLNTTSVAGLENDVTILASDAVLAEPPGKLADYPSAITVNGHDVQLYDSSASLGRPGPTDPFGDLAVRQRLISEAALRTIGPQHRAVGGLDAVRLEPRRDPRGGSSRASTSPGCPSCRSSP